MGRRPNKIIVTEVTFGEPTGFETTCPWTEATKILLRIQARRAAQSKQVTGVAGNEEAGSDAPPRHFPLDASALIADFCKVAALSGVSIASEDIEYETLFAPHTRPKRLPSGRKGVYVFASAQRCLKVGKVGSKSAARFTSQHYVPNSSQSNLAKSLLSLASGAALAQIGGDTEINAEFAAVTKESVGIWIEQNTSRHHFLLHEECPDALLNLLEVFLQCRLDPLFERG